MNFNLDKCYELVEPQEQSLSRSHSDTNMVSPYVTKHKKC